MSPNRLESEARYGEPVELKGRFEIDPIPGGKRLQGSWLVMEDGTRYVISYRPVPEYFAFLDKRVIVHGRPYWPGTDTQHVGATHLFLDSIELAPGEVPYSSVPTEVPEPPIVRRAVALADREECWTRVIAVVRAVDDDPDGYLCVARLEMEDGTPVWVGNVLRSKWSPYIGQTVTVTGRWQKGTGARGGGFVLFGWYALLAGDVSVDGELCSGRSC